MYHNSKILIRKAQPEDFPAIYALVVELAVYEKEPDAVLASVKDFLDAFESGLLQSTVAEVNGKIVGMACYYLTFSTWRGKMMYLEDFVVSEEYRRMGIGQKLFDAVLAESKDQNCKLLKWQVLLWNEPALEFYLKNEAIIEKEWWNGKILFQKEN